MNFLLRSLVSALRINLLTKKKREKAQGGNINKAELRDMKGEEKKKKREITPLCKNQKLP